MAAPATHPAQHSARIVGNRYRLLARMGAGGMATVYRAHDKRLGRDVAVKIIAEHLAGDELFLRRFRNEGRLCARLVHPHIVATLDVAHDSRDSSPFIVMELVDGLDARKLLLRRGRMTAAEAVRLVTQVGDALAYAHAAGVVHRDVSLPNILVRDRDGTAKLADFGLAFGAGFRPHEGTPAIMGTPGYVAPELLFGAAASPSSDLYALGVVAYRLLAGLSSFSRGDPQATAPMAYAAGRVAPLAYLRPDLPGRLIAAVRRAMADEPHRRQASVDEFCAELCGGRSPVRRIAL